MDLINKLKSFYHSSKIGKFFAKIDKIYLDVRSIKQKGYEAEWRPLSAYMFEVAKYQTAEYIIKNMPTVKRFSNKFDFHSYALSIAPSNGLVLEFGVWQGETINHIAKQLKSENCVYGFDSFEGLPEDWRTGFEKGVFKLTELPKVEGNVILIKGWFDKTLPDFIQTHKDSFCSYIHIDADLYSSTVTIFNLLSEKIISGTIIAFDEYFGHPGWQEGEYKAFQEFIKKNKLEYEYVAYTETEQVAVRIK